MKSLLPSICLLFLSYGCGSDLNLNVDENDWNCGSSHYIANGADRNAVDTQEGWMSIIYFDFTIIRTYNEIDVALQIIDKKKNVIRRVFQGSMTSGPYRITWDFTNESGERVAPGLYRAQLISDDKVVCEGDIEALSEN